MSTRSEPWPTGTPCWTDISVPDIEAAKAFYGAVFGWSFLDTGEDFGHYSICQIDGRAAAAISPQQTPDETSAWTVYIASDDVDSTAKLIADNGGTVVSEPMDIPDTGKMCIALDPQGAVFGVWQSQGMLGTEVYGEPGSLIWTDVRTTDPDASRAFYAAVFGYRYESMGGMESPEDYTTIGFDGARDGQTVGGIGPLPAGQEGSSPDWVSYFLVADADAALASAKAAGGSIVAEPFDTPYGPMAGIADPNGAVFFIVGPPAT